MSNKFLKNFLINNHTERKTKTNGFLEKTTELAKKGKNKHISLEDIKELVKYFDEEQEKKGGKYLIRARNIYRDNITVRDSNGNYYNDDPDYFSKRPNYDPDTFQEFDRIQIIYSR